MTRPQLISLVGYIITGSLQERYENCNITYHTLFASAEVSKPMLTPWGASQHQHKITDGVYEVDTAGHGGILVGTAQAKTLLSPQAIAKGWKWGSWYAYEEDCDWAIFAYEQPELYTAARNALPGYRHRTAEEMRQIARECLARWHSDYLAQVEGGATHTEV